MTAFSFGDYPSEDTDKENITSHDNLKAQDINIRNEKKTADYEAHKSKPPANLFKPWVDSYINQRANQRLAAELKKVVFEEQKPKPSKGRSNKVLQVYRSNRVSSQGSSACCSSRGSSTSSRLSGTYLACRQKKPQATDQRKVEERCDKYYSDYLRVRIKKRSSDSNIPGSVDQSLIQNNSSRFLGKLMSNSQNFCPHISEMTQHSFDSHRHSALEQAGECAVITGPRLSSACCSQLLPDSQPANSYGFIKKKLSEKFGMEGTHKKIENSSTLEIRLKREKSPRVSKAFGRQAQPLFKNMGLIQQKQGNRSVNKGMLATNKINTKDKPTQKGHKKCSSKVSTIKVQPKLKKNKQDLAAESNLLALRKSQKGRSYERVVRPVEINHFSFKSMMKARFFDQRHRSADKNAEKAQAYHPFRRLVVQRSPEPTNKAEIEYFPVQSTRPTLTAKGPNPVFSKSPEAKKRYFLQSIAVSNVHFSPGQASQASLQVKDRLNLIHNLAALKTFMRSRSMES